MGRPGHSARRPAIRARPGFPRATRRPRQHLCNTGPQKFPMHELASSDHTGMKRAAARAAGIPEATTKRTLSIPLRNHRSTLAQIPATRPISANANGIRLQSNRYGIISSIALRAFKAFLPIVVVLQIVDLPRTASKSPYKRRKGR